MSVVRQQQILDLLAEEKEVYVKRLAEALQVSGMTIRRDLKLLEQRGRLSRVHGGAVCIGEPPPISLTGRAETRREAKDAIAPLAAALIQPDDHVLITGSSTTLVLAEHLVDGPRAHYVTNSIDMALLLSVPGHQEAVLTGGTVRPSTRTVIGTDMLRHIEHRVFDLCFIGVTAVDLEHGFLGPTEWHAYAQRVMRRQCRRVVVLADHSKFGALSNYCLADLSEVDVLVTDRPPPAEFLAKFAKLGTKLIWPVRSADTDAPN